MNLRTAFVLLALSAPAATIRAQTETGNFIWTFDGSFPAPPSVSRHIDYRLMPTQEQFFVHIPASYTGSEPYGLVVFTHAGDRMTGLPCGWAKVLDANKLVLVAAQSAGNKHPVSRRLGLAVLGALEMKARYNIDPRRIYAAGFSGGARMSNLLGFYQSDLFTGTIQNCGADFYRPVPQVEASTALDTAGRPYGLLAAGATASEIERARSTVRFVMITGGKDFRRGNILDVFNGGYLVYGFQAMLFDVPNMEHDFCDARTLAKAIAFLEGQ